MRTKSVLTRTFSAPDSSFPVSSKWIIAFILIATAALWSGALRVGFSTDDYIFIQKLAPIRSIADVIRPFWSVDPNPQYWRPVANASAALDFLVWGWNGQGFHATNFVLHLIATFLVYVFARRVLLIPQFSSALAAIIFGIAASHESNILWPAARADILATIFTMLAMIAYRRGLDRQIIGNRKGRYDLLLSYAAFILALLSKENAVLVLPILIVVIELPEILKKQVSWKSGLTRIIPYLFILALVFIVRSNFTIPIENSEPLMSEGSTEFIAFARNAIYGIGYALIPLDLEQATYLLAQPKLLLWAIAVVACISALFFWLRIPREARRAYFRPGTFFVIASVITMQSFERWRYYMPSIGLFALAALFGYDMWRFSKYSGATIRNITRVFLITIALAMTIFHISRALSAEDNWRIAANEVDRLKESLKTVLSKHFGRLQKLDLLDVPAKLGSASVMQVARTEFVRQSDAELLNVPGLKYGSVAGAETSVESAVDVYSLDIREEFSQILWRRLSDSSVILSVAPGSHIRFEPALFKINGASRRDWKLKNEDQFDIGTNRVTIIDADGSFARAVEIDFSLRSNDSDWRPIIFDGNEFRELQ